VLIGIDLAALITALSPPDLTENQATEFLEWLQTETVQYNDDGPLEPILIIEPAPHGLDLAFPFAVVEGKAYATGKQIFEAENQAAVSAACALKIQLDLDRLVSRVTGEDGSSGQHHPLFFSITTQGPIHELWYYWTVLEEGRRKFGSKLCDSYNVLVLERAEALVVKLDNVTKWGTGSFARSVVERLRKVAAITKAANQ
jgi:hypothetical protein